MGIHFDNLQNKPPFNHGLDFSSALWILDGTKQIMRSLINSK